MTERPTHAYCPECKEESAITPAGSCLWCGGPTEQRERPKRGGWKRPDLRGSRYTEAQLRSLHVAHMRGASMNSLAKQTYEKVGYASPSSAQNAISREWRRLGLPARDRIEQTVLSSTKHGRKRRSNSNADERAYRRWLAKQRGWRALQGPGQEQCEGIRTQPPREGERCERPSQEGSRFCLGHDPERRAEVLTHLVEGRRHINYEALTIEPFRAWLWELHAEHGTWAAVGELVGVDRSGVHRLAAGPKQTIERRTVERYAEAAGITFDAIYEPERVAA